MCQSFLDPQHWQYRTLTGIAPSAQMQVKNWRVMRVSVAVDSGAPGPATIMMWIPGADVLGPPTQSFSVYPGQAGCLQPDGAFIGTLEIDGGHWLVEYWEPL